MRDNDELIIERKPSGGKNTKSPVIIGFCVLLLIAVMVISAVVSEFSGVSVAQIGNSSGNGSLIYDSLPDSIKKIEKYSSGLVMLTDTAVDYLDNSGKKSVSNSHQYSQPVMVNGRSSVLLYDKGGTSFRIEKNSRVYNTYTVASPITVATIDKNGNYAYVLNEDGGYQSHLYVYSYKGKKLFEWGSSSDYCISTALSDNGRYIAVSMLGVKNGEYISKIIFFNFKDAEALYTVEIPDSTVFRLEFLSGKNLAVFSDDGLYCIDKNGEMKKIYSYSPSEIMHTSVSDKGLSSVALALHGNTKDSSVAVFDKKFGNIFTFDYNSEIYSVCSSEKYFAVILSDKVEIFNKNGEKTGCIDIDEKCIDTAFSGNTLFILTVTGIYSFDVFGEYNLTEIKSEAVTEIQLEEKEESTTTLTEVVTQESESVTGPSDDDAEVTETASNEIFG